MDVIGSVQPTQNNTPLGSRSIPRVSDISQTKNSSDSDADKESQKTAEKTTQTNAEKAQRTQDESLLRDLRARDREVRAHEAAHVAAAGGLVRGGPNYTFQQGPDGRAYAVGGEVQLDVSPVAGDPQATIAKAARIRAAALAPSNPSAQDVSVASNAGQLAAKARVDLAVLRREEAELALEKAAESESSATEADSTQSDSTQPGIVESEASQANTSQSKPKVNNVPASAAIDVTSAKVGSADSGNAKLASEEPSAALNSFLTPSQRVQETSSPVFINQFA